ncbi:MAG: hypothetical protein ACKO0Z_10415 [Betaproteobacteria bacterium]
MNIPAFPAMHFDLAENEHGMTLRDYFAAKAMQGMLFHIKGGIKPQDCIIMAEDAYFLANAMMKAREA